MADHLAEIERLMLLRAADARSRDELSAALAEALRERDKLAATIKAYLGTDERAVHDAANLAHARDQRDAATARAERAEAALERTQMGQHVFLERARRAEAAIQRARDLAAFWQHAATSGSAAWLAGELLAALDSTDPPPDAQRPEERSDEGPKKPPKPCDCGHEFEIIPIQFHRRQCAYRRSFEKPVRSDAGLPVDGEERK